MEAPLWALLLLPLPPLLASLCARCRRPRPPQRPPLDNYDCKPSLSAPPPPRFMVVTPRCAPPPHPPQPPWAEPRKLGPPQAPSSRRVSAEPDPEPLEDGDYSNEPFASGYVTVLPDPTPPSDVVDDVMAQPDDVIVAGEGPEEGEGEEPYENVPEGEGGDSRAPSLEYINVPGTEASESDEGADYENL